MIERNRRSEQHALIWQHTTITTSIRGLLMKGKGRSVAFGGGVLFTLLKTTWVYSAEVHDSA